MSRSGCFLERALFVPPRFASVIAILVDDARAQFRAHGMEMPADLRDWLADLKDFGERESPPALVIEEPSAWLDVASAAAMYRAADVELSERSIREMAKDGRLRARRSGRPWQLAFEAIDLDITERKLRKQIGRRHSGMGAESLKSTHIAEEAS